MKIEKIVSILRSVVAQEKLLKVFQFVESEMITKKMLFLISDLTNQGSIQSIPNPNIMDFADH